MKVDKYTERLTNKSGYIEVDTYKKRDMEVYTRR